MRLWVIHEVRFHDRAVTVELNEGGDCSFCGDTSSIYHDTVHLFTSKPKAVAFAEKNGYSPSVKSEGNVALIRNDDNGRSVALCYSCTVA